MIIAALRRVPVWSTPVDCRSSVQMLLCDCGVIHARRRVVLTGGPGAGKSAVLELIRLFFCEHVKTLPEAAGIIFGGRFPRSHTEPVLQAAQRAIYHVQRELESTGDAVNAAVVLCDRGTVDGAAYWIGAGNLFTSVGSTREAELARYDTVIHLRTPTSPRAYNHDNPLRVESVEEAAAIDQRILEHWSGHPHRIVVPATLDFLSKASHVLALLRDEVPECCRHHVRRFLWDGDSEIAPQRAGEGA
jgi:predicted ATPase